MAHILIIETSSDACSVAIARKGELIASLQSEVTRSHASILTVLIEKLLNQNQITFAGLDAVAVSQGPGSYTGLRIGVSVAKGICYGAQKPLLAVNTLEAMMAGLKMMIPDFNTRFSGNAVFCPMLDARRQEVYTAMFSKTAGFLKETTAEIIEENSFADILADKQIVFFGSGAEKVKAIIKNANAVFIDEFVLKAEYISLLAEDAFEKKKFEDVAYFEPLYLKDFIATIPKRKVI
jgi:tRNA threonylcarbamoyladenosine biosynthesis protein TsaB